MNLVQLVSQDIGSIEFGNLKDDIREDVAIYFLAKDTAQTKRMIIIGKIEEFIKQYPQRSKEHTKLLKAYEEQGWSPQTRSQSLRAYRVYNELTTDVNPEFIALGKASSFSQLLVLSGENNLQYASAMYLKRFKVLPTVNAMRGRLAGRCGDDFRFHGGGGRSSSEDQQPELPTTPINQVTLPTPTPAPAPILESTPTPMAVVDVVATPINESIADSLFNQLAEFVQTDRKLITDAEKSALTRIYILLENYGYGKITNHR